VHNNVHYSDVESSTVVSATIDVYTTIDDSTSLVYISIVHSLMQPWSPDEHCLLLYMKGELDHANSLVIEIKLTILP